MTVPPLLLAASTLVSATLSAASPPPTHSLAIFLAGEAARVLDLPDTPGDGLTDCDGAPAQPYPVSGGGVWGAVGTAAGYTVEGGEQGPPLEIMICGGTNGSTTAECYGWGEGWEERRPLLRPTVRGAGAKFGSYEEGEFWWVSGGAGQDGLTSMDSSQIYDFTTKEWLEGPVLPVPMQGHCKVGLNSTHTLVIGGDDTQQGRVFLFSWVSGEWVEVEGMVGGDRFSHGCALLGEGQVLVAAGYHGLGTPEATDLATAEILDLATLTWRETAALPWGMDGSALVAVEAGPWAGQVLSLGGHQPDSITGGDMVNFPSILRFTAEEAWEEVGAMPGPRAHFVTINLPLHCQ